MANVSLYVDSQANQGMGHVIFALDTQVFVEISNVYTNLKDQMKLDLCICEALSCTNVTAFVGVAINYH